MKLTMTHLTASICFCCNLAATGGETNSAVAAPVSPPGSDISTNSPAGAAAEPWKMKGEAARIAIECGLTDDQLKEMWTIQQARMKALREVNAKSTAQILGVFNPEQRSRWNEATLMLVIDREFKKAGVTEDQTARIKRLIAEETKDSLMLVTDDSRAYLLKFKTTVFEKILTPEQRAIMKSAAAARPAGGRIRLGPGATVTEPIALPPEQTP